MRDKLGQTKSHSVIFSWSGHLFSGTGCVINFYWVEIHGSEIDIDRYIGTITINLWIIYHSKDNAEVSSDF